MNILIANVEDLVFVHNNLNLLPRVTLSINNKMWNIGGVDFGSMEDVGILKLVNFVLDDLELNSIFSNKDVNEIIEKEND